MVKPYKDKSRTSYRSSIWKYYWACIVYVSLGIFLGLLVNSIARKIQDHWKLNNKISIVIQIILMITVLYIVEVHISNYFATNWQSNTPGLFFVSFFFGTQFLILINLSLTQDEITS